jgi:hypothetical protein
MGKASARRVVATSVRGHARRLASSRRKHYGEVLTEREWAPPLAAILLMADDGKFTIKGRPFTWPGLTNYSLRRNLRQIGIETKPDDPVIARCVDHAYRNFGKRMVTRAELGEMLNLTKAERVEFKIWQILPCDETTAERRVWLRKRDAEQKANRRRMQGSNSRVVWLMKNNLSKTKPWEAEGISRKTWYKRQAKANSQTGG